MSISQIIFIVLVLVTFGLAFNQFGKVIRNIRLGKSEKISGNTAWRWKKVLLVAFGQKKMFKRPIPAFFHLFIYLAFLLTQVELIEIFVDGLGGVHRYFAPILGGFYSFMIGTIEILSLLAFIATIVFLWRRNILRLPRFFSTEMDGWPRLDGNLILIGELFLLIGIFSMNGADTILQGLDPSHYPDTGFLAISGWLGPLIFGHLDQAQLIGIERFGWWLHIIVVFGFITYLPYSKHLHIFFAFPNVYFTKKRSRGEMENMPEIMNEVKSMMGLIPEDAAEVLGEIPEFGAKDIGDLSWKTILEAYTCTECGRCTSVCPANITGKKLSPRKVMMDIRDRAEEVGKLKRSKQNAATSGDSEGTNPADSAAVDEKDLFSYISHEELYACTTCNACVEACPVLINPVEPILALRRYDILTNAAGPQDWLAMFNSIENSGSVWAISEERTQWSTESEI